MASRHSMPLVPIALVALLAGCGTRQGVATRLVTPAPAAAPSGGAQLSLDGGTLTVGQLQTRLMAYADRALGEVARATAAARQRDSSPETRLLTQLVQTEVGTSAVTLAVAPDPEAALLDLMVSAAAQRQALQPPPGAKGLAPAAREPLQLALSRLERDIWALGGRVYGPAELQALRDRVDQWTAAREGTSFPGVVRVADLPGAAAGARAKGLFAPIEDATRQIEETRLLGERFLFLAQRLPVLSRWQAEALSWEAMNTPEARQTLGSVSLLSGSMARLTAQAESLPALIGSERAALLAAFDAREATLRGLLHEAGAVTRDGRALAESGERLMTLSQQTAATLGETIRAADRLVASLRDPAAPGGAASFDVEKYTVALRELRAATEALNSAVGAGQGLTTAGRGMVDHAAWRAAQLLVLVFGLLLVYRWVAPRLAGGARP